MPPSAEFRAGSGAARSDFGEAWRRPHRLALFLRFFFQPAELPAFASEIVRAHPPVAYRAGLWSLGTAYVGTIGQAVGAGREYSGIMSKPWRMVVLALGDRGTYALHRWDGGGTVMAGFFMLNWTCFIVIAGCLHTRPDRSDFQVVLSRRVRKFTIRRNQPEKVRLRRAGGTLHCERMLPLRLDRVSPYRLSC